MKSKSLINIFISSVLLTSTSVTIASDNSTTIPADAPNGIAFPVNYQDWAVVAVSHREDNKTLRSIVGNPVAIKAIEDGKTNPWPDGAILGKMVWKDRQDDHWKAATVPGKFIHAEFMFKDSQKWAETGGWGWARWLGTEQKPFGKDRVSASASCVACHTPVKGQDWVFTRPAIMPKRIQ